MRANERVVARRQLDKRLNSVRNQDTIARPPKGWIKAIREALGMTTAQLARRLGVSQPRAVNIEQAEVSGAITLQSLERAAQALDCRLVYALVPRLPLEVLAEERALILARKRLKPTEHSMALEAQSVDTGAAEEQVRQLAARLLAQSGSSIWEPE
jgi:predicted DNA-binding mobile mystery protein A